MPLLDARNHLNTVVAKYASISKTISKAINITSASNRIGNLFPNDVAASTWPSSYFRFTARPSLINCLMPSEREASLAALQASTSAINASGMRTITCGSLPVAGRPRRFLGITFIDFLIN